jgi:hypothetical protein
MLSFVNMILAVNYNNNEWDALPVEQGQGVHSQEFVTTFATTVSATFNLELGTER